MSADGGNSTYGLASNAGAVTLSYTKVSGLLSANGGNGINGGHGGSILAATSTLIGNIFVNGGNSKTDDGGNGGYISITNTNARGTTASTTLSANGGNTLSCTAKGGDGGSVDVVDSGYDFISTDAGNGPDTNTCPNGSVGGTSGQHHETGGNITPEERQAAVIAEAAAAATAEAARIAAAEAARLAAAEAARLAALAASKNPSSHSSNTSNLAPIFTVLPNVTKLTPVKLPIVPIFGDTTSKSSFSLGEGISSFLFAPLPENLTQTLGKDLTTYLTTAGFSKEQDIVTVAKKPLLLPQPKKDIPGLFTISTKGLPIKLLGGDFTTNNTLPVPTYLTSDKKASLIEKVTTTPNTQLTITLKGGKTATFNGKTLTFTNNTLTLTTPTKPGTYTLTTSASTLSLLIEVKATYTTSSTDTNIPVKQESWFTRLLNYFF